MGKRIGKYKITKRESATSLIDGGEATGRLIAGSNRLTEKLTNTDVDAQANTLTAAQILGGIVTHTSVTGISYADTGATILENGSAILMARRLTSTTVKMYIIGGA